LQIYPDNEIEFTPDGELVGLIVVVGPDSGVVEVATHDGRQTYQLWDAWCHYARLNTVVLNQHALPGETVRLRITEASVDYSTCRRPLDKPECIRKSLRFIGFLVRC